MAERAREVAPHLDHGESSLANPDAIGMRVFQGDRRTPRLADKPLGRVRSHLYLGRELVAGVGLPLPVTTARDAREHKSSEQGSRHRRSHPLSIRGGGQPSAGPVSRNVTRARAVILRAVGRMLQAGVRRKLWMPGLFGFAVAAVLPAASRGRWLRSQRAEVDGRRLSTVERARGRRSRFPPTTSGRSACADRALATWRYSGRSADGSIYRVGGFDTYLLRSRRDGRCLASRCHQVSQRRALLPVTSRCRCSTSRWSGWIAATRRCITSALEGVAADGVASVGLARSERRDG